MLYSIAETDKENRLKTHEYFKHTLKETLIHQDEPAESYINDLLPWSGTLHNLCKSKNSFKDIPLRGVLLDAREWFTIYA